MNCMYGQTDGLYGQSDRWTVWIDRQMNCMDRQTDGLTRVVMVGESVGGVGEVSAAGPADVAASTCKQKTKT